MHLLPYFLYFLQTYIYTLHLLGNNQNVRGKYSIIAKIPRHFTICVNNINFCDTSVHLLMAVYIITSLQNVISLH